MENISALCDTGTQETSNLVVWKAEIFYLPDSKSREYFQLMFLVNAGELHFRHVDQTWFFQVQDNVKRLRDFQYDRDE